MANKFDLIWIEITWHVISNMRWTLRSSRAWLTWTSSTTLWFDNMFYKNSSGDKIANVNFLTTMSHTRRPTSKYRKKPTSFNKFDDR